MHNYDDLNFECRRCGSVFYRLDRSRELELLDRRLTRTCPVCGRVAVPNNSGWSCLHCSAAAVVGPSLRAGATVRLPERNLAASRLEWFFGLAALWAALMLITGKFVVG